MSSGLYLQQARGWRAGAARVGIDCMIVLQVLTVIEPDREFWFVVGAVVRSLCGAVGAL